MERMWVHGLYNTYAAKEQRGTVHDWHNLYSVSCIVVYMLWPALLQK